jgi:hypothetical protein
MRPVVQKWQNPEPNSRHAVKIWLILPREVSKMHKSDRSMPFDTVTRCNMAAERCDKNKPVALNFSPRRTTDRFSQSGKNGTHCVFSIVITEN